MVGILPLSLTDVCVMRRGKTLLGPVSMRVEATGATVVLGPNGAGKSTLLRAMHGLERISGGGVSWAVAAREAATAQAFVFQSPILLRRTVQANLSYPMELRRERGDVDGWLDRVGLSDKRALPAHRLSRGERQKLAVARALITRPEVVFLDEPTASLDGRSTREIEAILQAAEREGTTLVMATHDLGQARRMATHVVFLMHGRLHEAASADAFFDAPQTPEARAFLKGDIVE